MLDQRQREIAANVVGGDPGRVLLSELAPVITLGRRTPDTHLLLSREQYELLGIDLYPTDRGGFATYHGPGQWVLFPVARIESWTGDPRGVKRMIARLLESARRVVEKFEPQVEIRDESDLGVWVPQGKIAAVGIHVENQIVLHGLSLNIFRTQESFAGLMPCGLKRPVAFLEDLAPGVGREELMKRAELALREEFS